ncbi:unnamed protein product [Closterium sp. NIES-53]
MASMQSKFLSTSKLRTTKPFDGQDFYTWSFEFELLAQDAQIWIYYDGSYPFPASGSPQEKTQYYNESLLAFTVLIRNLSPEEQLSIRPFKNEWAPAQQSWEHLRTCHMATDSVTLSRLLNQLNNVKMFPGEKAGPYINRCRNLRDQFRKSGGNFPDDMFVTIILAGLSPEWRQCKSLLRTQGTLSETALCSTLLFEQKEIDMYNERGNKKEKIAFYARAPPNKKRIFCKYCKKTGHMIQDCWKLNGNNNNQKGAAAHQQGGAAARNQSVSPPADASTSQAPARLTANTSDKGKSKVLNCMVRHGPPRPNSHYRFFRNWEDMFTEPPQERPEGSVEEEEENDPTYDELTVGRMQFDREAPEWIQESPPARIAYDDEGCYYDYENDHDMEHHITPKLVNLAKTRKEVNTWYLS